ncbi:TPA: hypothetical protein SUC49_001836, partial [Streptococcus equi subsp. equi]|nr:hypothetical protein [Streptococcus equi subsp. equi]
FDKEKDFSISLGIAVVDKWLEKNKLPTDCDGYNVEELKRIIRLFGLDNKLLYEIIIYLSQLVNQAYR